jgi:hypothetical protein
LAGQRLAAAQERAILRRQNTMHRDEISETQFPPKVERDDNASRATLRRGRKPVVTPDRVQLICQMLARGESERAGCLRAGIGLTTWSKAKRNSAGLRERIATARDDWGKLRHGRHVAALSESQVARSATRQAKKPQPTHQAKMVVWHLTTRVPLNLAAIPEAEIARACERFNLPLETWQRQEHAFGLLKKVYAKRAVMRGQYVQAPRSYCWAEPNSEDSQDDQSRVESCVGLL